MKRNLQKGFAILLVLCLLTCGAQGAGNNTTAIHEPTEKEKVVMEVMKLNYHTLVSEVSKIANSYGEWEKMDMGSGHWGFAKHKEKEWLRAFVGNDTAVYYNFGQKLLYIDDPVQLALPLKSESRWNRWIYNSASGRYFNIYTHYECLAFDANHPYFELDVAKAADSIPTVREVKDNGTLKKYFDRIELAQNAVAQFRDVMYDHIGDECIIMREIQEGIRGYAINSDYP